MRYDEIRIELFPTRENQIGVRVTSAGEGADEGVFVPPPGADGETLIRDWFEAWERPDRDEVWRHLQARREEVGAQLFDAVFAVTSPLVRGRLIALEQQQTQGDRCGLRLRFLLGDTHGGHIERAAAVLPAASLPWELLLDRVEKGFLLQDWHNSVVRTYGGPLQPRPVTVHGPLRVLIVSAQPKGFEDLAWQAEALKIRTEISKRPDTQVEVLEHASLDSMSDRLRSETFHVLHFIGHGGFDPASGNGRLVFEENRLPQRISGPDLARRIGDIKTLRLVLLNACHSGELATHAHADPLGGVAAALSTAGIPSVVAMQVAVTDSAAVQFSGAFYSALRMGWPIEAAVAEGRKRIPLESPEWATPVHYLRGETSELFAFNPGLDLRADAPKALPIGIRTFVESEKFPKLAEWAKTFDASTERLLDLDEFFEGRFIRDPQAWRDPVLFRLDQFLREAAQEARETGRPLSLSMVAHSTVAFAAGYFFDTKSNTPITLVQSTPTGLDPWSADIGDLPTGPRWEPFSEVSIDPEHEDVAVVIEVSRLAAIEVEEYLRTASIPVGRLVRAQIAGGPKNSRVKSGAHAEALARDLTEWLRLRTGNRALRRLHLFFSAPNGFVFFCGQFGPALGSIRLYEYDLEGTKHGSYEPSLDLPAVAS